jgi:hypothetical protein
VRTPAPRNRELTTINRPARGEAAAVRSHIHQLRQRLLTRAQEAGALRPDLVLGDMFVLLWSQGPIIAATYDVAPQAWREASHRPAQPSALIGPPLAVIRGPPITGAPGEKWVAGREQPSPSPGRPGP